MWAETRKDGKRRGACGHICANLTCIRSQPHLFLLVLSWLGGLQVWREITIVNCNAPVAKQELIARPSKHCRVLLLETESSLGWSRPDSYRTCCTDIAG